MSVAPRPGIIDVGALQGASASADGLQGDAPTPVAGDESKVLCGDATWKAIATPLASGIHGATAKTTPADDDELGLLDSAAAFILKKLTWAKLRDAIFGQSSSYSPTLANLTVNSRTALTTWALTLTAGTDAATTMAANTRYDVDMSAWATADRNYTLPTNAAVGDEIEVYVQIGNASYELILKTGAGQTCAFVGSTIAAATEITRLFITGESMRFRYHATNKWECVRDGRIPQQALMRLSTSASAEAANTFTQPTTKSGAWTADVDNASITTVASDQIKTRRAGNFEIMASGFATACNDTERWSIGLGKNGTATLLDVGNTYSPVASAVPTAKIGLTSVPLAVDDYLVFMYLSSAGSRGITAFASPRLSSSFALKEAL